MTDRRRKVLYWVGGLACAAVGLWAGYTQFYEGRLGQPDYVVLKRHRAVEFRRYQPFIVASVLLEQRGEQGLRGGFRRLAGYIFGGNRKEERLAMTAPVLQQNAPGESLPMTAPVLQSPDQMRMAFVMPRGRTLSDLPVPNNSELSLTTVDWGEAAVIRFSGAGRQARFRANESRLRAVLQDMGHLAAGPALYAQYNSPSAFPPLRRNEVIIPLARKSQGSRKP